MNAIFFSFSLQTHSQHYSISSCAYSGLHNNRRLLSRSLRYVSGKISFNADFTLFSDSVHVCNHGTVFSYMVGLKWRHNSLTILFSFNNIVLISKSTIFTSGQQQLLPVDYAN